MPARTMVQIASEVRRKEDTIFDYFRHISRDNAIFSEDRDYKIPSQYFVELSLAWILNCR